MRTNGSLTCKNVWNIKVHHPHLNIVLFEGSFPTITSISDELGLSYNQVWEMTKKGRVRRKQSKFRFMPVIELNRID